MDSINLIQTALMAGTVASNQVTTSEAIKDAYHGLKILIKKKSADELTIQWVLTKHEEKPDVWEAPLKEALIEVGADQDQEIIEASQKLIRLVMPQQAIMGKYNVQITGNVQGFAQGDSSTVNVTFPDSKP